MSKFMILYQFPNILPSLFYPYVPDNNQCYVIRDIRSFEGFYNERLNVKRSKVKKAEKNWSKSKKSQLTKEAKIVSLHSRLLTLVHYFGLFDHKLYNSLSLIRFLIRFFFFAKLCHFDYDKIGLSCHWPYIQFVWNVKWIQEISILHSRVTLGFGDRPFLNPSR